MSTPKSIILEWADNSCCIYAAEWVSCFLSAPSVTQQNYCACRRDQALCRSTRSFARTHYTWHLLEGLQMCIEFHMSWGPCSQQTRTNSAPSPKLVLETRAPLEKPVGESRLQSSGEPFISSAGAFEYSPAELSWQITHDPQATACWCLMQSYRWFKMISHTQVLYINKIQNLNQHKHTKMHWIRRKMWNLIKWEDTARAGVGTKYSINSHKKWLIILYSCWS